MKASEAKPVFRSFPYHSTAHTHIPTRRETQQRSPRQCLLCLPHTQGCTDCASAFSMALQLLTGQSPGDFLTAHSFQSRFTQLQNNLSPYWWPNLPPGLSQGGPADHDPASSAVRLPPATQRSDFRNYVLGSAAILLQRSLIHGVAVLRNPYLPLKACLALPWQCSIP